MKVFVQAKYVSPNNNIKKNRVTTVCAIQTNFHSVDRLMTWTVLESYVIPHKIY